MGTFMSKHCSPMSYGTPLEKKSCANYGSPLNQGFQDDAKKENSITESNQSKLKSYKDRANKIKLSQRVSDSLYNESQKAGKAVYDKKRGIYFDAEDKVLINPPKGDKRYLNFGGN